MSWVFFFYLFISQFLILKKKIPLRNSGPVSFKLVREIKCLHTEWAKWVGDQTWWCRFLDFTGLSHTRIWDTSLKEFKFLLNYVTFFFFNLPVWHFCLSKIMYSLISILLSQLRKFPKCAARCMLFLWCLLEVGPLPSSFLEQAQCDPLHFLPLLA